MTRSTDTTPRLHADAATDAGPPSGRCFGDTLRQKTSHRQRTALAKRSSSAVRSRLSARVPAIGRVVATNPRQVSDLLRIIMLYLREIPNPIAASVTTTTSID
jgi:hypothetical protein